MKRLLLALLFPVSGWADESRIQLKEGPGRDLVTARCSLCHSPDYIPMNSPFLDAAGWEKEVDKMVKVMGAPLEEEELPIVLRYLNTQYGR